MAPPHASVGNVIAFPFSMKTILTEVMMAQTTQAVQLNVQG